jgi:hypothetical protein
MRTISTIAIAAAFAAAPALRSQELPKPTYQNSVIVSFEHGVQDSAEVDYIKANFSFGLYAWPSFSHTAYAVSLDWHAALSGAEAGIQAFKDQVDVLIAAAKAKNVRIHIVIVSGLCRGVGVYREAKEEDIRNVSWYNDNKLASDAQIFSSGAMDTYLFGTLSRYARKLRANLEAKARAALAFLKQRLDENPDTLLLVSGWGEAEMNYHRLNDSGQFFFGDYSPFAVLEFRDWIQHTGMYDDATGKYRGQGYLQGGAKYQGSSGLARFNADFGTIFSSWNLRHFHWSLIDDYDPFPEDHLNNDPGRIPFSDYSHGNMKPESGPNHVPGGFDPPRTLQPGNSFWELWVDFRESMVGNFVLDMGRWAAEAGISPGQWSSHQIPADCLFGSSPESPSQGKRFYSSASPVRTANIIPFGSAGATVYDAKFPAEVYPPVYARTSLHAFPNLASMSSNWALVEYDAEGYPAGMNVSPSSPEFLAEQYLQAYDQGVHFINFWRWIDEGVEHMIKGTNKEDAIALFVARIRDKARSTNPSLVFSPPQVASLTGQYAGSACQTRVSGKIWPDEGWDWTIWGDFSHFEIYRGTRPNFAVDPAHYLGRTNGYIFDDSSVEAGNLYYYKWLAVNVNGAKGPASAEVRVAAAAGPTVVLSGKVQTIDGGGVGEVTVIFSNGGGTALTDASGSYSKLLMSGWSGEAVPGKAGFVFSPARKAYSNATADRDGEDFAAAVATYVIMGSVRTASGAAVEGVVLNGLPGNPSTDALGRYSVNVTHGWSGTAIPTKTGYSFVPSDRRFAGVTADLAGQDFSAAFSPETIIVTSPNGGESWEAGSIHPVTWTTSGQVGSVNIEFSPDNGQTWTTIAALASNTGTLPWTVPGPATAHGLVRVSQAAGGAQLDVSDGPFSVTVPISTTIVLTKRRLRFGATTAGAKTAAQKVYVRNGTGGNLNWTATVVGDPAFYQISPTSGTGGGAITVLVNPTGLAPGPYSGRIIISDPKATNSPQTISVDLTVFDGGLAGAPFGTVESPSDGTAGVEGAFAFTGWALDDVEVASVKIWRDPVGGEAAEPNGYVYVGDAVFVEGARPDVEQAYPSTPLNGRAGWGYMVLSNFLPNRGNGTFRLHAIATDAEGRTRLLGSKTVTCENARAVLPFGAIDTPAQGGAAWGKTYLNFGWTLTPLPKSIPNDGSTMWVWVDGVPVGHPSYNNFRSDIAGLFPGLANSNGAVGYFILDTTAYADGLHTIAWSVRDSGGVSNGVGSRYFMVTNDPGSSASVGFASFGRLSELAGFESPAGNSVAARIGYDHGPTRLGEGVGFKIRPLERIAVSLLRPGLEGSGRYEAYLVVGDDLRPLPVGSTFDPKTGALFWQPGPGFRGEYDFLLVDFVRRTRRSFKISILPD